MQSSHVALHPLFPTLDTKGQMTDLIYSDHLPIFTEVPLAGGDTLKLLSLNVMGAGVVNNITRTKEDESIAIARYSRIAKGLKLSSDKLDIHAIALQEVTTELMIQELLKEFGEEWAVYPSVDLINKEKPQQLTLYNKRHLELLEGKPWDERKKTLSTTFKMNETGKIIHFHNVWTEYNFFPDVTEKYYTQLLQAKKDGEMAVILGDTNSRLASISTSKERNLTTGIIPPFFYKDYGVEQDVQVPDHPDGGFYTDDKGKIVQLTTRTVDLAAGDIKEDDRDLEEMGLDSKQEALFTLQRPVLCLDDQFFSHEKFTFNGLTFLSFEDKLRKAFNDEKILVRFTSTVLNQHALMIRFKNTGRDISLGMNKVFFSLIGGSESGCILGKKLGPAFNSKGLNIGSVEYPYIFIPIELLPSVYPIFNFIKLIGYTNITDQNLPFLTKIKEKFDKLDSAEITLELLNKIAEYAIGKAQRDYTKFNTSHQGFGKSKSDSEKFESIARTVSSLGVYSDYRMKNVSERLAMAKTNTEEPVDILLNLLHNDDTGHDLKSFRYFLVSYFFHISADTDENANLLIDTCIKKLKEVKEELKLQPPKSSITL